MLAAFELASRDIVYLLRVSGEESDTAVYEAPFHVFVVSRSDVDAEWSRAQYAVVP